MVYPSYNKIWIWADAKASPRFAAGVAQGRYSVRQTYPEDRIALKQSRPWLQREYSLAILAYSQTLDDLQKTAQSICEAADAIPVPGNMIIFPGTALPTPSRPGALRQLA